MINVLILDSNERFLSDLEGSFILNAPDDIDLILSSDFEDIESQIEDDNIDMVVFNMADYDEFADFDFAKKTETICYTKNSTDLLKSQELGLASFGVVGKPRALIQKISKHDLVELGGKEETNTVSDDAGQPMADDFSDDFAEDALEDDSLEEDSFAEEETDEIEETDSDALMEDEEDIFDDFEIEPQPSKRSSGSPRALALEGRRREARRNQPAEERPGRTRRERPARRNTQPVVEEEFEQEEVQTSRRNGRNRSSQEKSSRRRRPSRERTPEMEERSNGGRRRPDRRTEPVTQEPEVEEQEPVMEEQDTSRRGRRRPSRTNDTNSALEGREESRRARRNRPPRVAPEPEPIVEMEEEEEQPKRKRLSRKKGGRKTEEPQRSESASKLNNRLNKEIEQDLNLTKQPAKIITVYSAKGGVGKTTIACELATALALTDSGRGKLSVCIVDYNIDFGDVLNTLNYSARKTCMSYWASEIRESLVGKDEEDIVYSTKEIRGFLQKNEESGLYALLAPFTNEDSMNITESELRIMLENLRDYGGFDYIICDTGNNTRDSSYIALEMADQILMVLTQSVNTANCNDSFLTTMKKIHFDMDKFSLIINKVRPTKLVDISTEEIEQAFVNPNTGKPYPCLAKIKDTTDAMKANNQGRPLAYNSSHEFTMQIRNIISSIAGDQFVLEAPKKKKKGFFSFFK